MAVFSVILVIIGVVFEIIAWLWILGLAFGRSIVWGIICIFLPIASLVIIINDWTRAKGAVGLHVAAVFLVLGGAYLSSLSVGAHQRQAVAGAARPATPVAVAAEPLPPTHQDDGKEWHAESFDRAVRVTQSPADDGTCSLEARRGDRLLWKTSTCAGKKIDYKFVSPSGDRLAVVYPLPTIDASVRSTPVMRIFKRGQLQYASAAVTTVADWQKLRTAGSNFYWLAGALEAPGEAPQYADSGASFTFATVDGRSYHLGLEGK